MNVVDNPVTIYEQAIRFKDKLPALINISVCRKYWHVGAGEDDPPEWDRMQLTHDKLLGDPNIDPTMYKDMADKAMEDLWK